MIIYPQDVDLRCTEGLSNQLPNVALRPSRRSPLRACKDPSAESPKSPKSPEKDVLRSGTRGGIWRIYVDSGRMAGRGSETGQLHWVSSGRVLGEIPGEFGDRKRGARPWRPRATGSRG